MKGGAMKESKLTIPEVAAIASTRAALGGGLALLLADRIDKKQRKTIGWVLFLAGAITTIPLAKLVLDKRR
jgi:hypothetical protein